MGNAPPLLPKGTQLGNYEVIRPLGFGGFGAVYEARHKLLRRRVAIKCLHPHIAENKELAARFFTEMIAATRLEHPNVVQVLEVGKQDDGSPFMVMEYLEGETLDDRIKKHGRLGDNGIFILWQVAVVLTEAHRKGITHRDIKPSNLMLIPDATATGGERVKLLDFGIAKLSPEAQEEYPTGLIEAHTHTGARLGTPMAMAPEQWITHASRDNKIDVYAFGILAYAALSGKPPFTSKDPNVLRTMHTFMDPEPLETLNPNVPPQVAALVHRALNKLPDERPTMEAVRDELAAFLSITTAPTPMRMRATSEIAALLPKPTSRSGSGVITPTADDPTQDAPTADVPPGDPARQSTGSGGSTSSHDLGRQSTAGGPQPMGPTPEGMSRASGQQMPGDDRRARRGRWVAGVGAGLSLVLIGSVVMVLTRPGASPSLATTPTTAPQARGSAAPADMAASGSDAAVPAAVESPARPTSTGAHSSKRTKKRYVPPTVP